MGEGNICEEVCALVTRGQVTERDLAGLDGVNSWELEVLARVVVDDALIARVSRDLMGSRPRDLDQPCDTLDERLRNIFVPELIKRLRARREELAKLRPEQRYVASHGKRVASFDDASAALEWLVPRMFEADHGEQGFVHELLGPGGGEANLAGEAWWKEHGEVRTCLAGSLHVRSYEQHDGKIYENRGAEGSRELVDAENPDAVGAGSRGRRSPG